MDHKDTNKYYLSGLFFIIGIVLILFFVMSIGQGKGFGQSKFEVTVIYRNVGGLTEGAPVRLAGVNVGNVESISFLSNAYQGRRVRVILNILKKYKPQLMQESHFAIKTEGILGEKLIEIESIEGAGPADLSKLIVGDDPLDVQDLAEGFAEAAASFTQTAQVLRNINVGELVNIVEATSKSLMTTSEEINSSMEDLREVMKKSKRVLDRVEQKLIDGDLFKVF